MRKDPMMSQARLPCHTEALLNARRLTLKAIEQVEWSAAAFLRLGNLAPLSVLRALRWDLEQTAAGFARLIEATSGEGERNA